MSEDRVSKAIAIGKYDEAQQLCQTLSPSLSNIYSSKIAELTGHFEQALELGKMAMDQASTDEEQVAAACVTAYAHWRLSEFVQGHQILNAVQTQLSLKVANRWKGTFHNIQGLLYWKENRLEEALSCFRQALQIRQRDLDQSAISYTLNNIGNTFLKFGDIAKCREYYAQSMDLRVMLGHLPALAASENSFGRLNDAIGQFTTARKHHERSLELWEKVGNTQFIAKSFRFLAINASKQGDKDLARSNLDRSDAGFSQIENKTDLDTNRQLRSSLRL